jgi:hypothetical protein
MISSTLVKRVFSRFCGFLFILMLAGIALCSCASHKDVLRRQLEGNPVRTIRFWGHEWCNKPLSERIAPAPEALVDYLRTQNALDGFTERPKTAEPAQEFYTALKVIESQLPGALVNLAKERFISVFIVNDLGSSGFAEAVLDEKGRELYAFIVLDRKVLLERKANEWASWKENSIFRSSKMDNDKLEMVIEADGEDTVVNAICYILLHELGHVLGVVSGAHPSWNLLQTPIIGDYPFMKLSWITNEKGEVISRFEDYLPERKLICYYSFDQALLTLHQVADIYGRIGQHTNFTSMQGATNIWEDFAESFATYVHVVYEKRPWQVRIEQAGKPALVVDDCWFQERCRDKKDFMKKWFQTPCGAK